jgi:hypothetical protein
MPFGIWPDLERRGKSPEEHQAWGSWVLVHSVEGGNLSCEETWCEEFGNRHWSRRLSHRK